MGGIKFEKATLDEVECILKVVKNVVRFMQNELKIDQWDDSYPNIRVLKEDINLNSLYVLKDKKCIIGFICINKELYKEYDQVSWEGTKSFKTLHRVAIDPQFQGMGYGKMLYNFAYEVVKKEGIKFIRVDTFSRNIPMNNLIIKQGYNFVGAMKYKEGKPPWNCYEIKIK